MGAVNINFRSETFPLEQMVSTGEMLRLNQVQQRDTPPAATNGADPSGGTGANNTASTSQPSPSGDGTDAVAPSPA
jgi:hypothetical protein